MNTKHFCFAWTRNILWWTFDWHVVQQTWPYVSRAHSNVKMSTIYPFPPCQPILKKSWIVLEISKIEKKILKFSKNFFEKSTKVVFSLNALPWMSWHYTSSDAYFHGGSRDSVRYLSIEEKKKLQHFECWKRKFTLKIRGASHSNLAGPFYLSILPLKQS